jgi:hypothetical protein
MGKMRTPDFSGFLEMDAVIFSYHARVRMFERGVDTDDIIAIIREGEVIEEYPDDEPCPSYLFLGNKGDVFYHVVLARCEDHLRVITVYIPEPDKWLNNRKRRQ